MLKASRNFSILIAFQKYLLSLPTPIPSFKLKLDYEQTSQYSTVDTIYGRHIGRGQQCPKSYKVTKKMGQCIYFIDSVLLCVHRNIDEDGTLCRPDLPPQNPPSASCTHAPPSYRRAYLGPHPLWPNLTVCLSKWKEVYRTNVMFTSGTYFLEKCKLYSWKIFAEHFGLYIAYLESGPSFVFL